MLLARFGLRCDITEVLGIDDIHYPHKQVREAEILAAEAFGARATKFLVQGSTVGNQAMLLSSLLPGDIVLAPHGCHRSFYSGVMLSGAELRTFSTAYHPSLLCLLPPTPAEVERAVVECPEAKVLFLTSVTYQGACASLEAIVETAHRHGLLVLVDEAWGAHLPFHSELPLSALQAGADMVVHSLHKSTGALTPSGLLHFRPDRVDAERVSAVLRQLQTSSPSSLLVASIDCTRRRLALDGGEPWSRLIQTSRRLQERISALKGWSCFPKLAPDWDPARLSLDAAALGYSGYRLNETLRERFSIQCEMAELTAAHIALTPAHSDLEVDRLVKALAKVEPRAPEPEFARLVELSEAHLQRLNGPQGNGCFHLREAFCARSTRVDLRKAIDRRSADLIYCYPPGVPLVYPGQPLTRETVELLETQIALGGSVQGGVDERQLSVLVLG